MSTVPLQEVRVVPRAGAEDDDEWLSSSSSSADEAEAEEETRETREGQETRETRERPPASADEANPSTSGRSRSLREGLRNIVRWEGGDAEGGKEEDEDSPYCRICFDGPLENDPLFRACDCKGSVAYVHHACLSKWVSDSQRTVCELCHARFRVPPGIKPFLPRTAILHKACTVAADSVARSAALFNLLPPGSGAVTANSAIIYLRGYGHATDCSQLGLCRFGTAYPQILEDAISREEWRAAVTRLNQVATKMVNTGWRFLIFTTCLIINVCLIVVLSFVDHAVVIPFMFAVILIQLLPAVVFGWAASRRNNRVREQLVRLCDELTTQTFAAQGVTFGFHCITADFRNRNGFLNPYAVRPNSDPKVLKFLTVERGIVAFGLQPQQEDHEHEHEHEQRPETQTESQMENEVD